MTNLQELKKLALAASEEHPVDSLHTHRDRLRHECQPDVILKLLDDLDMAREALQYIDSRYSLCKIPCYACDIGIQDVRCSCCDYNSIDEFDNCGNKARSALAALGDE